MKKLFIFDIDGTVAKVGKASLEETNKKIRALEDMGNLIAFSSGKPSFYLCGFVRQMSLSSPILVGENGTDIQFGIELPPKKVYTFSVPDSAKENLLLIRKKLEQKFGSRLWFQPNKLECTPFFHFPEDVPEIEKTIKEYISDENVYIVHNDCFDIQYKNTSKGNGLKALSEMTGISPENMVSVGDFRNDYSMFGFTKYSVGINIPEPEMASFNFPDILSALDYMISHLG